MGITTTANRIRIESSAKNGTLGAQGAINADQIVFDTNISTNNGNLVASPSFRRRHVLLRKGTATEEFGLIKSVDVDGVTCTMQEDWDVPPENGDAYEVSYRMEDVATIAGCNFETDSRQWVLASKRLIVGTATINGFLGLSHGQVVRIADRGTLESGLRVGGTGVFCIGTIRNSRPNLGAILIFTDDVDNDLVWDNIAGAKLRLYEFALIAARNPTGTNSLDVTNASTDAVWARGSFFGIDAPFKAEKIYIPVDGEGVEIAVGDTVTWDGGTGTSTVVSFTNSPGNPFVKVKLANGDVYNSYFLEVI